MKIYLLIILIHISCLHLQAQSVNSFIGTTTQNHFYKYALVTAYKGKVALLGKYPFGSTITLVDHYRGKIFNTYAKSLKIRYDEYAGNFAITTLANQPPGSKYKPGKNVSNDCYHKYAYKKICSIKSSFHFG